MGLAQSLEVAQPETGVQQPEEQMFCGPHCEVSEQERTPGAHCPGARQMPPLQTLPAAQSPEMAQALEVSPPQAVRNKAKLRQNTPRARWNDDFMGDLQRPVNGARIIVREPAKSTRQSVKIARRTRLRSPEQRGMVLRHFRAVSSDG